MRKKELDPEEIKKLAALGGTIQEIADFVAASPATLKRRFQHVMQEGRASGIFRAKGVLFRRAMDGSVSALQFYLANMAGWQLRPLAVVNVAQNCLIPIQTPETQKALLAELHAAVLAAAHNGNESPRLANGVQAP